MGTYYASSPVVRTRSAAAEAKEFGVVFPKINDRSVPRNLNRSFSFVKEVSHAKPMYNPARNSVYARFSPNDWSASNLANFSLSDKERSHAERLRADVWRAVKITDQRTRLRQSDATKRLGERVHDINFWSLELDKESRLNITETELLNEHLRVLEVAYGHTTRPLHVAEECLLHRENRVGIDQVHDDVEKELVREVETIKKSQHRMRKLIEKTQIQLKLNRAAVHELDKDRKDKSHAHNVDDRMFQLKNSSGGIGYYPGVELVDNTLSIPDSWARYSQENIARSQKCRANSEQLRGEIDQTMRVCANEMWSRFNHANNAFNTRIQETTDARNKLQGHLQRTMQEIFDVEKAVQMLRRAIADKEEPMKVAQTRLEERSRRLNVENCNDPVMKTLQREIYEIRESIRALKDRLRLAESSLSRLVKTKSVLGNDITVKEHSLSIDSKQCMGMRKAFPMEPKVSPIFNMPLTM